MEIRSPQNIAVKKCLLSAILCVALQSSFSQPGSYSPPARPVQQLQDWLRTNTPSGYNSKYKHLTLVPQGNLHYLYPLWLGLKEPAKFKDIYSTAGYNEEMSQLLSFAGDYKSALEYMARNYDTLDDEARQKIYRTVAGIKDIQHVDARRYISFVAHTHRVVMINEAYGKPLHRAFLLSVLGTFYRQGFRYLAMEMLNNNSNQSLSRLTMLTGHYSSEPVAGELIRTAIDMGFKLVSYEDTAALGHTPTQRDSIQALNICKVLQQDDSARILVYGGYAHISKRNSGDGYIPMGLAFQRISGIEPYTIDQTDMTEQSNLGYGSIFYEAYIRRFPITVASVPLFNNQPVNITNDDLFDLTIIHPPTVYNDERPSWLSLEGARKALYVRPPAKNTFLVQAYYQSELATEDNKTGQLIPADQTYYPSARNNYLLYLRKGKYVIVFRDLEYTVLNTLNIEVE
ncbi:MAG: hypothetical protein P4L51_13210 [Puia sp.]|nr:hypothetical protein [Puia sp.]